MCSSAVHEAVFTPDTMHPPLAKILHAGGHVRVGTTLPAGQYLLLCSKPSKNKDEATHKSGLCCAVNPSCVQSHARHVMSLTAAGDGRRFSTCVPDT